MYLIEPDSCGDNIIKHDNIPRPLGHITAGQRQFNNILLSITETERITHGRPLSSRVSLLWCL